MDKLLTTPEAADLVGLQPATLRKKRLSGDGPKFVKLGRSVRYRVRDLTTWIEPRVKSSTSEDPAAA